MPMAVNQMELNLLVRRRGATGRVEYYASTSTFLSPGFESMKINCGGMVIGAQR